jgi:hypothetical protein
MNLCPYFPHLLSDFGENRCRKSACVVEQLRIYSKSAQGKLCFPYGRKRNTVKPNDFLKVKNALIQSVYHLKSC